MARAKAKEARNMECPVTSSDSGPRLRARAHQLRLLSETDLNTVYANRKARIDQDLVAPAQRQIHMAALQNNAKPPLEPSPPTKSRVSLEGAAATLLFTVNPSLTP